MHSLRRHLDDRRLLVGAEHEIPQRRGDAVVGAAVDEVVVEVMAARPPPVRPDARRACARGGAATRRRRRSRSGPRRRRRPSARPRSRSPGRTGRGGDDRGDHELLPGRREVVALDVVADVLDAERGPAEPPVVPHPAMDQVLEQRPGQHADATTATITPPIMTLHLPCAPAGRAARR